MDIISFILSLALEKGSDNPSASSVTYDPSTSVGLISTDVQDAIDELSTKLGMKMVTVSELPEIGEENILYIVPKSIPEQGNFSDEYTWNETEQNYDKVGDTLVSPLPAVTSSDNGKLLGVVNGDWDKIKNPNDNIASAYDSTQTYAVGDLVIYDNNLYECSIAINVAEAWDSTHWTQKTVAEELAEAGGSNIEIVTYRGTFPSGAFSQLNTSYTFTLDSNKKQKDIYEDIINGKVVYLLCTNAVSLSMSISYFYTKANNIFYCTAFSDNTGFNFCYTFTITKDSTSSFIYISKNMCSMPYIQFGNPNYYNKILGTKSDGSGWELKTIPTELPSVTSSDEGKVLTVNSNGEWVAQTLPDGTNISY